jgi:predicted amidophosphoribosyltransferase
VLWPSSCAACGDAGPSPCVPCARRFRPAAPGPEVPGLDVCRSLLAYEGPARGLVTGLKYRNDRAALGWLADHMAALLTPPGVAVVTWVPTSGSRRRRRGYDQAELLAMAVARRWGLPCRALLARRPGPAGRRAQTGAGAAARAAGPALTARSPAVAAAVAAAGARGRSGGGAGPVASPGARVVVVDDVTTTGATLRVAAEVLRGAGAGWVAGLTAARTPRLSPVDKGSTVGDRSRCVPVALPAVDKMLKSARRPAEDYR